MKLEFLAEVISNMAWNQYTGSDRGFRENPENASKFMKLSNLRKGFTELFSNVFGKSTIKSVRVASTIGGATRQGMRIYIKLNDDIEIVDIEELVKGISQSDVAHVINDYIRKGGIKVPHEMIAVKSHVYYHRVSDDIVTVMVDVTWPSMVTKIDDSSYVKKIAEYVNKLLAANELVSDAKINIFPWHAPTIHENGDGSKVSVTSLSFDILLTEAIQNRLKAEIDSRPDDDVDGVDDNDPSVPMATTSPEDRLKIAKNEMIHEQVVVPINQKLQNILRKNDHLQDVYIICKKHPWKWRVGQFIYDLVIKEVI